MFNHHLTQFIGQTVRPFFPDEGITHPHDIYRISIDYDESDWGAKFAQFVNDPHAPNATGIVIGAWMGEEFDKSSAIVVAELIRFAPRFPNLQAIFLGDITSEENEVSWIEQSDVSPIFDAYPSLTHFAVRGGNQLQFGQLNHTHLKGLTIEAGGLDHQVVTDILSSKLPSLTHLELYLGTDDYGRTTEVEHLRPLLTQTLFPNLRYLGLRDAENADEIAIAIANAPILDQIDTLDLSLGTLTDKGGRALLESAKIHRLQKLDLHYHYLSDAMMAQFANLPILIDVGNQQREEDEGWRYVAVGE